MNSVIHVPPHLLLIIHPAIIGTRLRSRRILPVKAAMTERYRKISWPQLAEDEVQPVSVPAGQHLLPY